MAIEGPSLQWSGLIARAQALKKGDDSSGLPADPAEIAATRAFCAYAADAPELSPRRGA